MLKLIRELLIVSLVVNVHLLFSLVVAAAFSFYFFCLIMGLILFRVGFPNLLRVFPRSLLRFSFFR